MRATDAARAQRPAGADPAPGVGEASTNVATHLTLMARRSPTKNALVLSQRRRGKLVYTPYTFEALDRITDRTAHGLEAAGIRRGTKTILLVPPGPDFFPLVFALFKIGAVVVLIDPGVGSRALLECLSEVKAEAFVGVPKAHVARKLFGAVPTTRIHVTVGRRWFWGGHTLAALQAAAPDRPYEAAPTHPTDVAAILFTTGSTGLPKGAVYEHGMFDAQVRALRAQYGIAADEIDLPTFPLFALFAPALGMTAVIPDMDPRAPARVDPRNIVDAVREQAVTQLFGSPALLDRVGRFGVAQGVKLPSLRRVISAGAPVPPSVLEKVTAMLEPPCEIHTPYGATEALPVASIGSREILGETAAATRRGEGTCVGRPVGAMTVRVVAIRDDAIPTWSDDLLVPSGTVGELCVRGPVVTRRYEARPEQTALAKIADGDGFWHRMGDLGRIDSSGRIWFYGRKSHRVETAAGVLFTEPVEAIFNTHPAVYRSALVGLGKRPAQRPVVLVELEKGQRATPALEGELLALAAAHAHTRSLDTFLVHPGFPVDVRHNAKIFREKLAPWAAARLGVPG